MASLNNNTENLRKILDMVNELPENSGEGENPTSNFISGTVTSNENGEITLQKTSFEPKQMMVWNIQEVEFEELSGFDGVMLCAVKLENGHWVAHYMTTASGTYYIAQASAERAPYQPQDQGYGTTNIHEVDNSIIWDLGDSSYNSGANDFTNITLNYVLIG